MNKLLAPLAEPYIVSGYLSLKLTPFGKISLETIKRYCMGVVFKYFDNPIYVDSPIIQDKLTNSDESISIDSKASLRHTFHHFYFKVLKNKDINDGCFPLTYVEQGLLFRGEDIKKLSPFTRQTAFHVTDVHSFTLNKEQAMQGIASVINCVRRFESDWLVKFSVKCHVKDNSYIAWEKIQSVWGEPFEVNITSKEEALLALDFNIILPDGKEIELSALEIFEVEISGTKKILVDFTLGGAERILSSILESNNYLPFWLCPIQVIALTKNLNPQAISASERLRVMIVNSDAELVEYQNKYKIPEIFKGHEPWEDYSKRMLEINPDLLTIPLHKPVIVETKGSDRNELF